MRIEKLGLSCIHAMLVNDATAATRLLDSTLGADENNRLTSASQEREPFSR